MKLLSCDWTAVLPAPAEIALLVCQDQLGERMAGPAIRMIELARALAATRPVRLLLLEEPTSPVEIDGVEIVVDVRPGGRRMRQHVDGVGVVFSQPLRLHQQRAVARSGVPVVWDM